MTFGQTYFIASIIVILFCLLGAMLLWLSERNERRELAERMAHKGAHKSA